MLEWGSLGAGFDGWGEVAGRIVVIASREYRIRTIVVILYSLVCFTGPYTPGVAIALPY